MEMGFGHARLEAWGAGRAMQGWAHPDNVARTLGEPLACRAWARRDRPDRTPQVMVCAEICFMTGVVRRRVEAELGARLGLRPADILLCATHNHSGPGGYSSTLWFDIPCGGRDEDLVDDIVRAIVEAAAQAIAALEPARAWTLRADSGMRPLMHNRVWRAYNRNPDVTPVDQATTGDAVDPEMDLVRVDALDGRPLGLVSWLGLHGTCVQRDNHAITPDHKGAASRLLEAAFGAGFVAVLAQGPAGDVTSNRRWCADRKLTTGRTGSHLENRDLVAEAEAAACRRLHAAAPSEGVPLDGEQAGAHELRTFPGLAVEGAPAGRRLIGPELGLGVVLGTMEGPGPVGARRRTRIVTDALRRVAGSRDRSPTDARGGRLTLVTQTREGEGRVLGRVPLTHRLFPAFVDPELRRTQRELRDGSAAVRAWLPDSAPVQVQRVGPLLIAAVGGEPSTVAGRRLRAALAQVHDGPIAITTYAGEYTGYVVTPEEFADHGYESGSTMFGRWTLDGWIQELVRVTAGLPGGPTSPAARS